jgi:hypothetical protein
MSSDEREAKPKEAQADQPSRTKPRKKRSRPAARDAEAVVVDEVSLERHPRRALAIGAALLAIGLALLGTTSGAPMGPSDPSTWITVAALVVLIYGVHTFGRLGPPESSDAP